MHDVMNVYPHIKLQWIKKYEIENFQNRLWRIKSGTEIFDFECTYDFCGHWCISTGYGFLSNILILKLELFLGSYFSETKYICGIVDILNVFSEVRPIV